MTIFHARPCDLLGTRCCCRWHRCFFTASSSMAVAGTNKGPGTLSTIEEGKMRAVVRRKQCWKNECSLGEGGNLTMVTTIEQSLVDGVCVRCVFIQSVMQLGKSASTAEKKREKSFHFKDVFPFCSSATRGGEAKEGERQSSFDFAPTLPVLCSLHITAASFLSDFIESRRPRVSQRTHTQECERAPKTQDLKISSSHGARREIIRKPAASRMKRKNTKIREFQLKLKEKKMFKNKFLVRSESEQEKSENISRYSHDDEFL